LTIGSLEHFTTLIFYQLPLLELTIGLMPRELKIAVTNINLFAK